MSKKSAVLPAKCRNFTKVIYRALIGLPVTYNAFFFAEEHMSGEHFYITTPIYYVNDVPHIGHAYTTILADVLARYHRLLGHPTHYLTGTDEHGQKVQQAAGKAGISPQEQADRTVVRFQELWGKLEITHDDFIRTTEARHKDVVQEILQDLFDRGEIYKADYDGWYDVTSETFVTEKELENGEPPENRPNIVRVQESNYFFRMSKYRDWLVEYIEQHPEFIQPEFRRNETLGFLRKDLNDLCISRPKSRLSWGIELPFDADYVTYVWFDALVNYISAIGYRRDDERFAQWWPASCHLIGKDILTTHTVYWPTMLQAMGLPQARTIFAHGWWLSGASKMSKSLGNVVNPMEMIDRYGVDAFRYFLIAEMTLGQDASFTEAAFVKRYNADLANDLGNLANRVLSMLKRSCGGVLPAGMDAAERDPEGEKLWLDVQEAAAMLATCIDDMRLDKALARILASVRATNRYLELRKPWHQAKEEDKRPLEVTLLTAAECLRVCSALLYPVMPDRMDALRQAFGLPGGVPDWEQLHAWGQLVPGTAITPPGALFPRTELKGQKTEEAKAPAATPPPAKKSPVEEPADDGPALITYEEFSKVQLMTAKVITAECIKGADKLLRLEVMMGAERRQLVAGIARHYDPADLPGKTVVVVANLKPAKLRGVESQGMILAATKGESLKLVTLDGELSSGADVR